VSEIRRALSEGRVVAGSYAVEHLLGQGSSGEVWAATDTATGAPVALKVLVPGASGDRELAERFRREAYFLARTASDHVARIHDFVCDAEVGMVLVMERVEGESLATVLDRGPLTVEQTIALGIELLQGVEVLHAARVIHRDLKPGNILMRPSPDGRTHPVICDFGLSRLARCRPEDEDTVSVSALSALTKGEVALGTVKYMAPEQVLNARQATEHSDLYAVGAILHRAVTGSPPFGELGSPGDIAHAKVMGEAPAVDTGRADPVALGLELVIGKALRRRPSHRYANAASMRAALAQIADLASHAEAPRPRRSRLAPIAPLALVAGIAAVFAAGVATGRGWTHPARSEADPPAASPPVLASAERRPPPLTPTPELVLPPTAAEPAPAPSSAPTIVSAPARVVPPPPLAIAALPRARASHLAAAADDDNPY
jgi:serine/threonine-protein kinase